MDPLPGVPDKVFRIRPGVECGPPFIAKPFGLTDAPDKIILHHAGETVERCSRKIR